MSEAFEVAIALVLDQEGGYQCRPDDPGNWTGGKVGAGELLGTKYGISAASYCDLDIAALTRDEAIAIYARDFWPRWSLLPPAIAVACMDTSVNNGVGGATRILQHALNHLVVDPPLVADGDLGPKTLAAALGVEPRRLLHALIAARFVYDASLPNWTIEAWGWSLRMLDVFARCEALLPQRGGGDDP